MSILGRVTKGTTAIIANGLDYMINKGVNVIENKYGESKWAQTVSEIGTSTVRVSKSTVDSLTDVVDGGIDAGIGYLSDDENKKNMGYDRMKTGGKEIVVGVKQGVEYTCEAGSQTTSSALKAGKYYAEGNKELAHQELTQTKAYAKNLAKVVAVGLIAFGAVELGDKGEN